MENRERLEQILSKVFYQQYPMTAVNFSERMRSKLIDAMERAYQLDRPKPVCCGRCIDGMDICINDKQD